MEKILVRHVPAHNINSKYFIRFNNKFRVWEKNFIYSKNTTICQLKVIVNLWLLGSQHDYKIQTTGYAKCNKVDTYNKKLGEKIAYTRALRLAISELNKTISSDILQIGKTVCNLKVKLDSLEIREKEYLKKLTSNN